MHTVIGTRIPDKVFSHLGEPGKSLLCGLVILLALGGFPYHTRCQSSQDVPVGEPRFTRILGSDTIGIDGGGVINARSVAVSPDGRWIAWTGNREGEEVSEIWLASTTGSEPVRVSPTGHDFNANPVWFPDSRRLAFRSGSLYSGPFIFTVALDPQTGRPQEPPRQVSIEPQNMYGFAVSPDGSRIAYVGLRSEEGLYPIRVVPTRGGTARTLWEGDKDRIWWPVWSPDGGNIYVLTHEGGYHGAIRRIPAEGGPGEIVAGWKEGIPHALSPDGRYVARQGVSPAGDPIWELATIEGPTLARFDLPDNMAPTGFWPGEPALVAVASEVAASLQVVPVNGGPTRQLTETRAHDVPLRWMPDGRHVFMETQLNGETLYMLLDVESGGTRQIRLPEPVRDPAISSDARYVGGITGRFDEENPVVKLFDVEEGSVQVVTDSPCNLKRIWPKWDGERFLYCETRGLRQEYRALTPGGVSEVLLSFPADAEDFPGIGVQGDRVAFTENDGEEGSLLLTTPGNDAPRRLVTLPGTVGWVNPVFAPNGRAILVGYGRPGAWEGEVLVVRLTADGELDGNPLVLELDGGPPLWWGAQWLPDGSGFVMRGMGAGASLQYGIYLVRLDPEMQPVELTSFGPRGSSRFCLSPDGRYIVYSSQRPAGNSIWKVELGDVEGR